MVHCTYDRLDYVKRVEKILLYTRENVEKSKDGMIILKLYDVIKEIGEELTTEPLQCQVINLGQALYEKDLIMDLTMHRYFKDILIKIRKKTPEDVKPLTAKQYKDLWIMLWEE